jgi:hypothetical protein
MSSGNDANPVVLTSLHVPSVCPVRLITVGVVLVAVGLVMLWASPVRDSGGRRRPRKTVPALPLRAALAGALVCTAMAGGVITGVQWAAIGPAGPAAVSAAVLGLPALLAGATVARLLALFRVVRGRRRQARRLRRGRGEHQ